LCNNIVEQLESTKGNYAYIDVGGGSTEVSLLHDGVLTHSQSYNIGTLRMLGGKVSTDNVKVMTADLKRFAATMPDIKIIGSGGNINKLYKLAHNKNASRQIEVSEITALYNKLQPLSLEERIEQFGLKVDRADVIVPAAQIFMWAADALQCNVITVPNISLADSIVDGLYRNKYSLTATADALPQPQDDDAE